MSDRIESSVQHVILDSYRYSIETVIEIWDDVTGAHWEVGPDRDALELVEIRSYSKENICDSRMVFPKEVVVPLVEALKNYLQIKT